MCVLSGGEAAKVRLCKIMLSPVNWLVLDEPTNHLDVEAKAELKKALQEFKGSILLVSHEPEFYEDWVDEVWNIEDWTTKSSDGRRLKLRHPQPVQIAVGEDGQGFVPVG